MGSKKRGLIFVLLGLFLIFSLGLISSSAQAVGCILHPTNEELYCVENTGELEQACAADPNCRTNPVACDYLEQCRLVTCGTSEGCKFPYYAGLCPTVVPEEDVPTKCFPGCCQVDIPGREQLCEYVPDYYQCKQIAVNFLGQSGLPNNFFHTTQEVCLNQCGVELATAKVTINVVDSNGQGINGAVLTLGETTTNADSSGTSILSGLLAGIYSLRIEAAGFETQTLSLSLSPGDDIFREITLIAPGLPGQIQGKVSFSEAGILSILPDAEIVVQGPSHKPSTLELTSNSAGVYVAENLIPGVYEVIASHPDYGSERIPVTLTEGEVLTNIDFVLKQEIFQGVTGVVYLDDAPVPGANIYVDGVYTRRSQGSGIFQIPFLADGTPHQLKATYAGIYEAEGDFIITASQSVLEVNLYLHKVTNVCTLDNWMSPQSFIAQHVPGKEQVLLTWQQPCPEVVSYQFTRMLQSTDGAEESFTQSLPGGTTFLFDNDVEWEQTYEYTIVATYSYGGRTYYSTEETASITLGSEQCADNVDESFCLPSSSSGLSGSSSISSSIYNCNDQNLVEVATACEEGLSCGPGSSGPICRSENVCSTAGNPFGLYYQEDACYGIIIGDLDSFAGLLTKPAPINFCYYDSTSTITDQCHSCAQVQSCFDYNSERACTINSCLTKECLWVDAASTESPLVNYASLFSSLGMGLERPLAVTPETGAGFCADADYPKDDYCGLCDPEGEKQPGTKVTGTEIFENYLCTPDVCTGLGRCFSNSELTKCSQCEEFPSSRSNCYQYTNELECTAGSAIQEAYGKITPSEDNCGWGRCTWDGSSCIKDSNVDGVGDCDSLAEADRENCKVDNTPPLTVLDEAALPIVSYAHTGLSFFADDTVSASSRQQSKLNKFGYCVLPVGVPQACTRSQFTEVPYSGTKKKDNLTISILPKVAELVDGGIYKISFFSEDQYSNRESIKETFVYIDNVLPHFSINESIGIKEDTVKLSIWLDNPSELMSCTFGLYLPGIAEPLQSFSRGEEDVKNVDFDEFSNIVWADLNVTCTDTAGNTFSQKKSYTFDLEERIEIISPEVHGMLSSTEVIFSVLTTLEAECSLQLVSTDQEVAKFSWDDDSRKKHSTDLLVGFIPREYAHEYKVVCQSFIGESFTDYFDFTIDITSPKTKITLIEQNYSFTPLERIWEASFIKSADIQLECESEGFSCDKIYFCLSSPDDLTSCPPFPNGNYQEYTPASPLSITEDSRICYYSTDTAGNKVYSANCGTVFIKGYGITFEDPFPYFYLDESWIISDQPIFDWHFSTIIPTKECRFDFKSEFDYNDIPGAQILTPDIYGRYNVLNFPSNVFRSYPVDGGVYLVYIKCLSLGDQISPEQNIYLEYDPNAPTILQSYANPNVIYEETKTSLFDVTDRKSICKYSDNSEGTGSSEFASMEYSFPGVKERILYLIHEDIYSINNFVSTDGKKEFSFNTLCASGAGKFSEMSTINFTVDYADVGYIKSTSPSGEYIYSTTVPLRVETSKQAICSYEFNDTFIAFEGDGKVHSSSLADVKEGSYQIPIRCKMSGGHIAEGKISFIIDLTPPNITAVEDGNFTCGSDLIYVTVYTSEKNVSSYYYEFYDLGPQILLQNTATPSLPASSSSNTSKLGTSEASSSSAARSSSASKINASAPILSGSLSSSSSSMGRSLNMMVANGTASFNSGLQLSTINLTLGNKYFVRAKVVDAAGYESMPKESNGVIVVSRNNSVCLNDSSPPELDVIIEKKCTETTAEVQCTDVSGCKNISYGQSENELSCNITLPYQGKKISFSKSEFVCYSGEDYLGYKASDKKKVLFEDEDGDSIADHCDLCSKTEAGKVVDIGGCAHGQVKDIEMGDDTDEDGLPDSWEKTFNTDECQFNYASPDTDNNGLSDAQDDYDKDEFINFDEMVAGTDPCGIESPLAFQCSDKQDNDGDKLIDYPDDAGCTSASDNSELDTKPTSEPEPSTPPSPEESQIFAWALLFLGIFLVFGGAGYLIYFYQSEEKSVQKAASPLPPSRTNFRTKEQQVIRGEEREGAESKPTESKRIRSDRLKSKTRRTLFGEFEKGKGSAAILKEEKKLEEGLEKEAAGKGEDIAVLKKPAGLFKQLESLSKPGEKRKVEELVTSKGIVEKKPDLFSKLQAISKKRKK